jgi:PAS domain S-box-containing protein
MIFIPVFNNISLLVTLSVSYLLIIRYFNQSSRRVQVINGVLFGAFVLLGMYNSVEFHPGVIFDGRSIILSVAGLFGGPVTGLVAMLMALSYRIWLGGAGVVMGAAVIVEAALAGIVFHYLSVRYRKVPNWILYMLMGYVVHIIMLGLVITLPGPLRSDVMLAMMLPVLLLYPISSFLVCMLFHSQRNYLKTVVELSESEGRFRELFFESQLVYLIVDPDSGKIIEANKVAERFYGYNPGELKKKKINDINILSESEVKLRMTLAFEKLQNRFVMRNRLATGELRDVEVFAGPVDYGTKTYLYFIVNDITERLKIENKLRESELSYRGLFDAVKDAIYIQNREGVFLDVNSGAEKMNGYERKDFIGRSPEFLSAPGLNDHEKLKRRLEEAYNGKEIEFEFWGKKKNGEVFPKYVRLYKGKYFGEDVIIAIGHDITHRKRAQKELEESRFDLKTLINVSDDLIILLDYGGNIIIHNKTFSDYYLSKGDCVGSNFFRILPADIASERKKYFDNVVDTAKPISFEDYSAERDWWVTYYPILDEKACVDRVAVYARDITLQRKMFNLQKNLQVAEKSAQLKQQFLSNMSHEMRTPMNGIVGMTDLMSKTLLSEVQQDYLNTIRESSNTLLSLINDVLDLARFESGKMPMNLEVINIRDFEQKISNLFRQTAISKGLAFSVDFPDDLPKNIIFDEKRLMQIIINLMGNALKFTNEGGIAVKAELVGKKGSMKFIKISVSDSGIGIDKDFIPNIFDEFAQLDNSKTRKYEGSGLGLAICKRIAEAMGGKIGVESVKGKGSTFWFTIKAEESANGIQPRKEITDNEFIPLGLNILMVEDKVINRKVGSLILKSMGCQVDMAENGLIGVNMVMKTEYDVVLMDIQMPVMDGITAVKTIRKAKIKQPYIIGLSAEAMEGDAEKYIREGMDDYLTKPMIASILYGKLLESKSHMRIHVKSNGFEEEIEN